LIGEWGAQANRTTIITKKLMYSQEGGLKLMKVACHSKKADQAANKQITVTNLPVSKIAAFVGIS